MNIEGSGAVKASLIVLAVLAGLAVVVVARSFLTPVMLAFLLALTFSPIRRWADRRGVPPAITSAVIVLTLLVGTASVIYALSSPVQSYVGNARYIAADVERKLRGVSKAIETVAEAGERLSEVADGKSDNAGTAAEGDKVVVSSGPDLLTRMAMAAPAVFAQIVFTLVLLYFLLASGDLFHRKIVNASQRFADKRRALEIAWTVERTLGRYFLTVTVINTGLGICIGAALWWLGMPNPVLFGVMAAVLNFIPFLGAIVGVGITAAIGIVTYDTVGAAAFAAGVYMLLTSIEGNFVTPYAVGRGLKLNPVLVFLSVAFWGWAWSFIGMFVAVPMMIALRVLAEHMPRMSGIALFLSSEDTIPQIEGKTADG